MIQLTDRHLQSLAWLIFRQLYFLFAFATLAQMMRWHCHWVASEFVYIFFVLLIELWSLNSRNKWIS